MSSLEQQRESESYTWYFRGKVGCDVRAGLQSCGSSLSWDQAQTDRARNLFRWVWKLQTERSFRPSPIVSTRNKLRNNLWDRAKRTYRRITLFPQFLITNRLPLLAVLTTFWVVAISATANAQNFESIRFADQFSSLQAAINDLASTGGTVYTPSGYRETITSQLVVGSSTKPVTLILGKDTILTVSVSGGGCAIAVGNASSIKGQDIGAGASVQGGASIYASSAANVSSLICNAQTGGQQAYFSLGSLYIGGANGASVSAMVDVQAVYSSSHIRDVVISVAPATGVVPNPIGLRIRNNSGGVALGPFECDNCWISGNGNNGTRPVLVQAVAGGGELVSVLFNNNTLERAGAGQYAATIDGSSGGINTILGVKFHNVYCEASSSTGSCFKVRDAQNVTFDTTTVGGVAGSDGVNISESASGRTFGVKLLNFRDQQGFSNLVNDTVCNPSVTFGGGGANAYVSEYNTCSDNPIIPLVPPKEKFASLGTPPNGSVAYCPDCKVATPASCTNVNTVAACTCTGGGTGAFAKRINGAWLCN